MKFCVGSVSVTSTYLLILLSFLKCVLSENLIQTINDTLTAEHYTYYRVSGIGHLRLELVSVMGDADLYISDIILSPTFDNYELKSTTCGLDIIDIPAALERPIGVAVYGYPTQNKTEYSLSVYFVSNYDDADYSLIDSKYNLEDGVSARQVNPGQASSHSEEQSSQTNNQEDISISETLWTILVTILKVVFEVLL